MGFRVYKVARVSLGNFDFRVSPPWSVFGRNEFLQPYSCRLRRKPQMPGAVHSLTQGFALSLRLPTA